MSKHRSKSAKRAAATAAREAKSSKALVKADTTLADKLIAQFRQIREKALSAAFDAQQELAEIAYRLNSECGLSQLKIARATECEQPWISKLLKWREGGYNGRPSIHTPEVVKTIPAGIATPDATVGMPSGPKLTLLSDNRIVATGNDVDTEASAEARKVAMGAEPVVTEQPVDEQPPVVTDELGERVEQPPTTTDEWGSQETVPAAVEPEPVNETEAEASARHLKEWWDDTEQLFKAGSDLEMAKADKQTAVMRFYDAYVPSYLKAKSASTAAHRPLSRVA